MNKELEILTLSEYLQEEEFKQGVIHIGKTFSRVLPATNELPAITVGLGLIRNTAPRTFKMSLMPTIKNAPNVMLNTFINEVAEHYLKCSEILPDQWQELLLLNLGYAKLLVSKENHGTFEQNSTMFENIPTDERLLLLKKHGFHKIATFVAYGHTDDIDTIITTLDGLNSGLEEPTSYDKLMELLALGVPPEDLELTAQLPLEMVRELYEES